MIHLHVLSEYSLLESAARLTDLARAAAELGMPALAVTDRNALYGAVAWHEACRQHGVEPITGCELDVAHPQLPGGGGRAGYPLVLLAQDEAGYRNLVRLVSLQALEGRNPTLDDLAAHSRGLFALTGGPGGAVAQALANPAAAAELLGQYRDLFGAGSVAVELQDHGLAEERRISQGLVELARRLDLPVVATNGCRYVRREDADAYEVLRCIGAGCTLQDPGRPRLPNQEYYLKPAREMEALFGCELPEALRITRQIAERCVFRLAGGSLHLPVYRPLDAAGQELPVSPERHLRDLCRQRLTQRYPGGAGAAVLERLEHELQLIERLGFASYFLIVADFVGFARQQGIAVGPGRGSGAGSLVAYLLGITDIDPLHYGLVFERFLNPERVDWPDFDIDFCYERRGEVIDYVRRRYGSDRVAQVITFGTLGARAALRDVGRVLGYPAAEVDRLARRIPAEPGITLEKALESDSELRSALADPGAQRWWDLARAVEGLPRHASVHAAGVVITPRPLVEHVPVTRGADGSLVTQFGMDDLKQVGLLKMDFLGLRTLTVLDAAVRAGGLDRSRIPLDDAATFEMLARGETVGVFQLESPWVRDFLRQLAPSRFEDIVATVALCRPGPMENIPAYLQAKRQGARYVHPLLEPVLKETYGVMIYQEQILQVAAIMAGFTLGQADLLRRAVAKKNAAELERQRAAFLAGCAARGHAAELAEHLYDLIMKFANYGFNKAHSVAYGLLAYQTAYCKRHRPNQFFAALLTSVAGNAERVAFYAGEARRLNLRLLPPDVNRGAADFQAQPEGVRFGLAAVRHVGQAAAAIAAERESGDGPYRDLPDFCRRVGQRLLHRKAVESLIKAGACDALHPQHATLPWAQVRTDLLAQLDEVWEGAQAQQRYRQAGQATLFDLSEAALAAAAKSGGVGPRTRLAPAQVSRRLEEEKEALGFYLSAHPLDGYRSQLERGATVTAAGLAACPEGAPVALGGMVVEERRTRTRAGEAMAVLTLEDLSGTAAVVLRPRVLAQAAPLLAAGAPLLVRGTVSRELEQVKLMAQQVQALAPAERLYLRLNCGTARDALVGEVRAVLAAHRGAMPVWMFFEQSGKWIECKPDLWVDGSEELLSDLERLLGAGAVVRSKRSKA